MTALGDGALRGNVLFRQRTRGLCIGEDWGPGHGRNTVFVYKATSASLLARDGLTPKCCKCMTAAPVLHMGFSIVPHCKSPVGMCVVVQRRRLCHVLNGMVVRTALICW